MWKRIDSDEVDGYRFDLVKFAHRYANVQPTLSDLLSNLDTLDFDYQGCRFITIYDDQGEPCAYDFYHSRESAEEKAMSNSTGPGSKVWNYSQEAARMIALTKRELGRCKKAHEFDQWLKVIITEGSIGKLNDDDELEVT